jgi:hypothetical protein
MRTRQVAQLDREHLYAGAARDRDREPVVAQVHAAARADHHDLPAS